MKRSRTAWLIFALVTGGLVARHLANRMVVPFHPDESTYIFMSRDFETVFLQGDWRALSWEPGQPLEPVVRYRLLNAPLAHYLIGLSRWRAGQPVTSLNRDWVWGRPLAENAAAVPSQSLLYAARLPMALLAALGAGALFWIGRAVGGAAVGVLAAVGLGLNPLMLTHADRAMTEGPLVFFSILSILGIWLGLGWAARLPSSNRRWVGAGLLTGGLIGLALASKQSAVILVLVAGLAGLWALRGRPVRAGLTAGGSWLASLVVSAGLVFFFLNPILYRHTGAVLQTMLQLRGDLAQQQVADRVGVSAEALTTFPDRAAAALVQVFLAPVDPDSVPAYGPVEPYFASPWIAGPRQLGLGALSLALALFGVVTSALRLWRRRLAPETLAEQVLWLWLLTIIGFTLAAIPLNWQRYYLPLLPPVAVFAALGLAALLAPLSRRLSLSLTLPLNHHDPL